MKATKMRTWRKLRRFLFLSCSVSAFHPLPSEGCEAWNMVDCFSPSRSPWISSSPPAGDLLALQFALARPAGGSCSGWKRWSCFALMEEQKMERRRKCVQMLWERSRDPVGTELLGWAVGWTNMSWSKGSTGSLHVLRSSSLPAWLKQIKPSQVFISWQKELQSDQS